MENLISYNTAEKSQSTNGILDDNISSTDVANSITVARSLLEEEKFAATEPSYGIDDSACAIGKALKDTVKRFFEENVLSTEENLILLGEQPDDTADITCTEPRVESDDEYVSEPPENAERISLEYKRKAVAFAEKHPKYSLKTLNRAYAKLTKKEYLERWKNDLRNGGTVYDKLEMINTETFERFQKACKNDEQVTTRILQKWAMSVAFPLLNENFTFIASRSWARNFKRKYRIKHRKVIKFISKTELAPLQESVAIAEKFQRQTRSLMKRYPSEFVINSDECRCQYEKLEDFRGNGSVLAREQNSSETIRFYTVQYGLTAAGTLLPHVFICTRETENEFSPEVSKTMEKFTEEYGNVIVTCSKSAKEKKELFVEYSRKVLKPYVGENQFLLIVDSSGGRGDPFIYDDIFANESDEVTCTVKVIPPNCTPLCQPCDVYFYTQMRHVIKRLQNASTLLKEKRDINSREDVIKMHSIVHHQLSSPIFQDVIKYAWYASKLLVENTSSPSVDETCFPSRLSRKNCDCKDLAFIQCARCRRALCFHCFYDLFHPKTCK